MIVVGENLKSLISQYNMTDSENSFDETSIVLRLSRSIIYLEPDDNMVLNYGNDIPKNWIKENTISDSGIVLPPKSCLLACSQEVINMPIGYMGMLQTKGSLARLFVSIHCSDSQVDSGYSGRITFEICNFANFSVRLFARQPVAQLFIFKTTTKQVKPYNGRYYGAKGPTIQKQEK